MPVAVKQLRHADYLERYNAVRTRLPGAKQPYLARLRQTGATAFAKNGFPTIKTEAWRYTNLAPLLKETFAADAEPMSLDKSRLAALEFGREAKHRLVFVNGALRADLSAIGDLPPGVTLAPVAAAARDNPALLEASLAGVSLIEAKPLAALNTALLGDGIILNVAPGRTVEAPIDILWIGTGGERPPIYHPRNAIVLGAGAHATIVERHVGLCIGSYFSNSVTEVVLGESAMLRRCKIQDESREAFHIALTEARLGAGAQLDTFVFSQGGRIARDELNIRLEGKGASCRLFGAYLGRGEQHLDHTTLIEHVAPETTSKELYKGVLDGKARGVFQGKIVVHPGAQKSDGHQLSRALLLSANAETDIKPELEIFADDVKCSHGATAGELDETQLFYLRSRGIPEVEARRLLIEAFLGEVIGSLALTGMRLTLEHNLTRWMGRSA